jgi:fibronectin type 3 domain-containing protein
LTARQSGGKVLLRFTLPRRTTGGSRLETRPTLEILRAVLHSEETAEDLETVFSERAETLFVLPPEAQESFLERDTITFPLTVEPNAGATQAGGAYYAVRALSKKGAQAGLSNLVALENLPVPLPPKNFRAQNTENGVRLEWDSITPSAAPDIQPEDVLVGYRIFRSNTMGPGDFQPVVSVPASNALITSFVDKEIKWGFQYHYRIRTVVHYGNERVESTDSNPVSHVAEDRFPPTPPLRLIASEGPGRVDLSWDAPVSISVGEEIQGYFIYRSEQSEEGPPADFIRLNLAPIPNFSYTDITAEPGIRYTYVVTALDTTGNESSHSNQASATALTFEQETNQ